jgi:hypothetical protein
MSFIGQSMKNRFPAWSKVRTDDSSNYGILLDTIGEEIDQLRKAGLNFVAQEENIESKPTYEKGLLYKIDLNDGSSFPEDYSNLQVENVRVTNDERSLDIYFDWGKYNTSYDYSYSLEKIQNDFFYFEFNNTENGLDFISHDRNYSYSFKKPSHIYISLENIQYFKNERTNKGTETNSFLEGNHKIIIRGINELRKRVEEVILVNERKTYKTKERFLKIFSLEEDVENFARNNISGGPGLEIIGLGGKVVFSELPFNISKKKLPKTLSIAKFNPFSKNVYTNKIYIENDCCIEHLKDEDEYSSFRLAHRYILDEYYHLSKDRVLDEFYFEEELCRFELFNANGSPISLEDFAYDEVRDKVVGIDRFKKLYYFEIGKPSFKRNSDMSDSLFIDCVISSESNYVFLEEVDENGKKSIVNFNLSLQRPKGPVNKFGIFKYTPEMIAEENIWDVEFLQENKDWGEGIHLFSGKDMDDLFDNLIPNFSFQDTLRSFGQYDYFVVSFQNNFKYSDKLDFKKRLNESLDNEKHGIYLNKKSLLIPRLTAEKEYDLIESSITLNENESYGICFSGVENKLTISINGTDNNKRIFIFKGNNYKAYFNQSTGCLYHTDDYESLSVRIGLNDGTNYSCEVVYE